MEREREEGKGGGWEERQKYEPSVASSCVPVSVQLKSLLRSISAQFIIYSRHKCIQLWSTLVYCVCTLFLLCLLRMAIVLVLFNGPLQSDLNKVDDDDDDDDDDIMAFKKETETT